MLSTAMYFHFSTYTRGLYFLLNLYMELTFTTGIMLQNMSFEVSCPLTLFFPCFSLARKYLAFTL